MDKKVLALGIILNTVTIVSPVLVAGRLSLFANGWFLIPISALALSSLAFVIAGLARKGPMSQAFARMLMTISILQLFTFLVIIGFVGVGINESLDFCEDYVRGVIEALPRCEAGLGGRNLLGLLGASIFTSAMGFLGCSNWIKKLESNITPHDRDLA